ncbi:PREDICTED: complex I intermediate-associated protein 30, mitochondrial [Nanorana parkeri]|uniref:complex I intermediate-associated protein 30, mitochondrial n=1 Tax=Nanorana parkeri TaxID=125878 RepID=UPI000854CBCC|nr:PREDICTED: complex I intermediate-associated protein 30, mitochondrial [Nanorana parkeri]
MRGVNFSHTYQGTKALCPLLYSSLHHPVLQSHARCYRRPGTSPDHIPFWKKTHFSPKNAAESVKKNINLMFKEIGDHLRGPGGKPLEEALVERTTVLWNFRSPEDLQKWIVSTDMEIGGKSQASLNLGRNNQTALFSGVLNSEVPRDGETTSSGFCTLRARPRKGAFGRTLHNDWSNFNTLHLRIRGDGRPWMVNIQSETYFSLQWDDLYHYFLYTRGGPYWQDVKIPLSKFFMSSRGRVQDGQYPLWPDKVTTLGFTIADRADGPFQLEIDFIGLYNDQAHTEEFAYELYPHTPM